VQVSEGPGNRWLSGQGLRGDDYDRRFQALEASGMDVHGEADLVCSLRPSSVLDAGCGTGRVAVELARRGLDVVGVDLDPAMLAAARVKAPAIEWVEGDLSTLDLGRTFDLVVMAGNVMIFTEPGTEGAVLARAAAHLRPGGLLVAGFTLGPLALADYDRLADAAGLASEGRFATWTRAPFTATADYAVSLHRRPGADGSTG
jgi:SAM-dependent methyltransferase